MAIASLTLYVLISGVNMLIAAFTFDFVILRQFIKKRTMGTILLFMSYLFFTLGELSTIAGNYIYTFLPQLEEIGAYIQLLYAGLYGVGSIFFYFFANRHILQDSEIVKAMTSIFIAFLIGVAYAYSTGEVIFRPGEDSVFYNKAFLEGFTIPGGGPMPQYLPTTPVGMIMFLPIFFFIQLRIVVKIIRIRRGLDNKISRAGFTYIFLSVLFLILGTISSSFFLFDFVQSTPALNALFHSLRMFFNSLGFLFAYFGWVLPDWLKRRIRGKAWIAKEFTRKTHKIEMSPIATSQASSSSIKVIEVAEQ